MSSNGPQRPVISPSMLLGVLYILSVSFLLCANKTIFHQQYIPYFECPIKKIQGPDNSIGIPDSKCMRA